ncbi:Amidase [Penicillium soppii]|uniref:Amidase n=1 Tax=Penicillium soppii TaxID=69789 RepID=UPI0025482367|nr:Amidase [Penicillium soppii]KAJ5851724.1 Amidase [Penicillium soppii]
MSIVSISDGVGSSLSKISLRDFAAQLHIDTISENDAEDYLTLLRSLEAVLTSIDNAPDYIAPDLLPQPTLEPRKFWKPAPEKNPFNAWSHQCDLQAVTPTSKKLSGRNVVTKDNISVGGLPTTLGAPHSLLHKAGGHPVAPIDAVVVSRILRAGGIIKGTSTCESFCASPLSFTGGSSSGSVVLVAAHCLASKGSDSSFGQTVELAIGTDQAGSVRIPASYNGIYGLKPTFGLVPYTGAVSMSPMIDHLGPMAAELEDIAALLEVMAGYDGYDPRMTPEAPLAHQVKPYLESLLHARQSMKSTPNPGHKLRVGLLKQSFHIHGVAIDVRDIVHQTATRYFEAVGASVVEVSIPMHQQGPAIWTAATRPSMSSYLCQGNPSGHLSFLSPHAQMKWPPSQETYDTLTSNDPAVVNIMLSEKLAKNSTKAGLEAKAHRLVFALRAAYDSAFEGVDILVTPCAPTVAMPHPDPEGPGGKKASVLDRIGVAVGLTSNTCPFNVTGHPALNVPCGFSAAKGHPDVPLPVGMQIVASRWADEQLLEAAALFELGREIFQCTEGMTANERL